MAVRANRCQARFAVRARRPHKRRAPPQDAWVDEYTLVKFAGPVEANIDGSAFLDDNLRRREWQRGLKSTGVQVG
jgi:transposase